MRVDEPPPPAAADLCRRRSFLGIKSTYTGVLRNMPKEALPTGARTARILLALCLLPIRPTPRKLRCSRIALLLSASFAGTSEIARFYINDEVDHNDDQNDIGSILTVTLPLLPAFYVVVCANVLLVKGCILHWLIIEFPSPSHMRSIATLGLAASVCLYAFIMGYQLYWVGRDAANISDSAEDRELRLAAIYKIMALRVADALIGMRVLAHQLAFSVLWMSESSRVLVDTVARFEDEFVRAHHSLPYMPHK